MRSRSAKRQAAAERAFVAPLRLTRKFAPLLTDVNRLQTNMRELPRELREAFDDAVKLLPDWRGAPPEPEVMMNQTSWTISAICGLVGNENFEPEPMPDTLQFHIQSETDATYEPIIGGNYRDGARHVLQIIERRRSDYNTVYGPKD